MRKRLEKWQNSRKPRIRSLGDTQGEQMLLSAAVSQLDKAAAIGIKKLALRVTSRPDDKLTIHDFLLSKR